MKDKLKLHMLYKFQVQITHITCFIQKYVKWTSQERDHRKKNRKSVIFKVVP